MKINNKSEKGRIRLGLNFIQVRTPVRVNGQVGFGLAATKTRQGGWATWSMTLGLI
jgi:hypothetical protein